MIDRVTARLGRKLYEVPVGFKWFVDGLINGSYGFGGEALPPGYIKPFNDIFIQATAEGIGVYFSSGDNGDETGGNPANAAFAARMRSGAR